jgi:hypothetical protein
VAQLRAGRPQPPAGGNTLRLHPAAQVAQQVVDRGQHGHAVGQQRFVARAVAEVGGDGVGHLRQPALQRRAQAQQVVAPLGVAGDRGLPGPAQELQLRGQVHRCGRRG